ncbi:MAG: restriction endonuclease subunit S [Thermodesulfobacteriota bacterium]|nr:restriction endonuclease subunit S [Thermodesulfobacteriota bacterium]
MKTQLKNISAIHMGHAFRNRLEPEAAGNVAVIQMKDIDAHNRLAIGSLVYVNLPDIKPVHRVARGDVIFRSRGRVNTATLVETALDNAIVAAPLLRIRVDTKQILPEYLVWYINHASTQACINRQASGTISRMINKKTIAEMTVDVPPLDCQQRIAAIAALAGREQELLRQLTEKRKALVDGILMKKALNT